MLKAIGRGLILAGLVLIALYFVGLHVRGPDALSEALDPLAITTYLAFLPLTPGASLLWLSDLLGRRRRRHQLVKLEHTSCVCGAPRGA